MIKITKGALAMVLAGSVTFSVANALLGQPIKQLTKEIALPISADRKKADVINPAEKKDKPQTPAANVKNHDIAVIQVSLKNRNTNDTAVAAVQQSREKSSDRTTTSAANPRGTTTTKPVAKTIPVKSTKAPTTTRTAAIRTTTKPAAPTIPATSAKAPTTATTPTTSKTSTTTTKTNKTTSATTTKTNRGQQVSQAAKEKAASQSNKKENNGKKM
ncbi:hypothetical protein [Bacillus sp. AFS031507]|uniref:hypothetical protein n=1 Tax=Bacillus sp. AFS031507 TaxID=2033496 RepID=UPI000BFB8F53|nr:hypothetical protein [Bacillus sp. AFS031507]PGY12070.1 hypothetical protein COE25_10170 [Bacillus sp. AFS031507]